MLRTGPCLRVGGRRTASFASRRLLSSSSLTTTTAGHSIPLTHNRHQSQAPASCAHHASALRSSRLQGQGQRRSFHGTHVAQKRRETFNLADIGEGITECEVIKWSLPAGTRVSAFDPLCEVQSDKATVEITSPFDGIVVSLLVQEGEIAKVGKGLCVIEVDEDEEASSVPSSNSSSTTNAGSAKDGNSESVPNFGSGTSNTASLDVKVGEEHQASSPAHQGKPKKKHPLDPSNPAPRNLEDLRLGTHPGKAGSKGLFGRSVDTWYGTSNSNPGFDASVQADFTPTLNANAAEILAPPSIRHLAKTLRIDLAQVAPGSGKDGRIQQSDLDAYVARSSAHSLVQSSGPTTPTPTTAQGTLPPSTKSTPDKGEDLVVELGRTRWNMYRAMAHSLSIPHFGYTTQLDITELHALLPLLNANIPEKYLPEGMREGRKSGAVRGGMVDPMSVLRGVNAGVDGGMGEGGGKGGGEGGEYTKLTYLPFLLKTLAKAMMEWPLLRSSITVPSSPSPPSPTNNTSASASSSAPSPTSPTGTKPTLTIRPTADINLALSTPTGLYTPTLVAAERESVYGLAARVKVLSELGRQIPCALTPAHMPRRGGTLTVSNVGAVGAGVDASPVLVPGGGVAIVALGRAGWVWDVSDAYWGGEEGSSGHGGSGLGSGMKNGSKGGQGGPPMRGQRRLKLPVSWSADHRVVEGAELAAFVETWRGWVERPGRFVGEGV